MGPYNSMRNHDGLKGHFGTENTATVSFCVDVLHYRVYTVQHVTSVLYGCTLYNM